MLLHYRVKLRAQMYKLKKPFAVANGFLGNTWLLKA